MEQEFNSIYTPSVMHKEGAKGRMCETFCGPGSELKSCQKLIDFLEIIIQKYNIKSITDIGCGDLNYMKNLLKKSDIDYIGYDISSNAVKYCNEKFPQYEIKQFNICNGKLPGNSELVIVKDVFIHLNDSFVNKALSNILSNKEIKYLLVTGHLESKKYEENIKNNGTGFRNFYLNKNNILNKLSVIEEYEYLDDINELKIFKLK